MWDRLTTVHPRIASAVKHGILPALLYLLSFLLLTLPTLGQFFTAIWGDRTDGLQNAWNLWWVNLVTRHPDLYPSIWYTDLLHWPYGTTLVGHTLNPFNGYLAVFLLSILPLKAAYNTIIIFAFVLGGVTMYWLAYSLTRSYWPSLVAGFMFTFSSFHFMHLAAGHLQVVSLEWLPLFLLCWHVLLKKPGVPIAIAAAVALWLVILCDDYFFLYCIMTAALMLGWYAAGRRGLQLPALRDYVVPLGTFAAVSLILSGPLVYSLFMTNLQDPLKGAHDAATYSLDLLALFVPGHTWLFNQWTQGYWSRLIDYIKEDSAYLTIPAFVLLAYTWIKRKSLDAMLRQQVVLWSAIMAIFFLLALGPVLHIAGVAIWDKAMPYSLLGRVLPFLDLSGVPARMTVMVILAACILSAIGLKEMFRRLPRAWPMVAGLLLVLLFQTLAAPVPVTTATVPDYVRILARLPDDGGVVDLVKDNPSLQLYYQTIHGKPIAFGYVARVPDSVSHQDAELSNAIASHDYARLWDLYHIRYIVTTETLSSPSNEPYVSVTSLFDGKGIQIYRLGCACDGQ